LYNSSYFPGGTYTLDAASEPVASPAFLGLQPVTDSRNSPAVSDKIEKRFFFINVILVRDKRDCYKLLKKKSL
jgi:hypothetical protein